MDRTDQINEIMDARMAADYLYMSMPTLYAHTSRRSIPYYKSPGGKKLYFKKTELDAWLLSNRIQTTEEIDTSVRPLNNTPAEPVRVNPCQFYAIFSRNLSFLPKFAIYSPQNASNLFIFSGNPEIWIDLSYLTIAK